MSTSGSESRRRRDIEKIRGETQLAVSVIKVECQNFRRIDKFQENGDRCLEYLNAPRVDQKGPK